MKRHLSTAIVLALVLVGSAAVSAQNGGEVDFSRYVALGDSLTAGYANASLIYTNQATSLGAILHARLGAGGTFEQPWVLAPGLRNELQLYSLSPLLIAPRPGMPDWPVLDPQDPDPGSFPNIFLPRPYDNLGIPGMTVGEALETVCRPVTEQPYYCLILRNPECEAALESPGADCGPDAGGRTALEQTVYADAELGIPAATFVTVWLGPNDVLGAVLEGVTEGTITPVAEFAADYREVLSEIAASGAHMAVANVPNVTRGPWLETVPPFLVSPVDGQIVPLIGPGGVPLTAGDRVMLPALALLDLGCGIPPALGGGPVEDACEDGGLPDELVLDADELDEIRAAIDGYNAAILAAAEEFGAAHVDAYAGMNQVFDDGVVLGGIQFTADFLTGGLFSYDAIHPTGLANGLAAQWFVDAINGYFGLSIPPVDLGPLVFGNPGSIQLPVGMAEGARLSPAVRDQLLSSLGYPSVEELREIERRLQRERMRPHKRDRAGDRVDGAERRLR